MSFNLKDADWSEFKSPPKYARPLVRWWWTGLDVDKEELIKEVQELDEAGFLGAEIQSFMIAPITIIGYVPNTLVSSKI